MNKISSNTLRNMIVSGANELIKDKDLINSLNVFPVPDGDTGTNMSLTIISAVNEMNNKNSNDIEVMTRALSKGALKGARGNSGVILSQLFRGFATAFEGKKEANMADFSQAIESSSKAAYKAVMVPKEGTILTVSKDLASAARFALKECNSLEDMMEYIVLEGNKSLQKTKEMLPELKEANVIDSGGKGLINFYTGMMLALKTNEVYFLIESTNDDAAHKGGNLKDVEIKYIYCTEFLINSTTGLDVNLGNFLHSIGDSIVLVEDDNLIKVHLHTNEPHKALEIALLYGEIAKVKIDNMKDQHSSLFYEHEDKQRILKEAPKLNIGLIAIANGSGNIELFKEYGIHEVINGGQSVNPSTEDILTAVENINSDNIIILPNNKNIILSANQAKDISKKNIAIVPTLNITQGFAATLNFCDLNSLEENVESMTNGMNGISSGSITYAIRDTLINGNEIKTGDILALQENKIIYNSSNINGAFKYLLKEMINNTSSFITVYYGEDIRQEDILEIRNILENYGIEYELIDGGQPLYYFLISVE
ncbi:MAG: DAK2 domain-containing protein [Lachnospirales bacterium]